MLRPDSLNEGLQAHAAFAAKGKENTCFIRNYVPRYWVFPAVQVARAVTVSKRACCSLVPRDRGLSLGLRLAAIALCYVFRNTRVAACAGPNRL